MTDAEHDQIVASMNHSMDVVMHSHQLALDGANAEIARLWRENERLKKMNKLGITEKDIADTRPPSP